MNFKNILASALVCLGVVTGFTGCSSDEDPYFTASADDLPRILSTDIPEGSNGEPGTLMTINRNENFVFEVIVTPVSSTNVAWFVDGKQMAEGLSVDIPLLAGEHEVKIVATTNSGNETSRVCKVVVKPLDGDPVPATKQKERLVAPGTKVTLQGKNMSNVKTVVIGDTEIACTYNTAGGYVEYTVPADMAEGTYVLTVKDAEGTVFGAGSITLDKNPVYVQEENVLWEGSFDVTWSTPFNALQTTALSLVKVGTILRVYVEGNGQGCVASAWWRNIITGHSDDEREDIQISGSQVLVYELTELSIQLMKEQDGMLIVGDGYTVKKVTAE